jgi:hypothetical protein
MSKRINLTIPVELQFFHDELLEIMVDESIKNINPAYQETLRQSLIGTALRYYYPCATQHAKRRLQDLASNYGIDLDTPVTPTTPLEKLVVPTSVKRTSHEVTSAKAPSPTDDGNPTTSFKETMASFADILDDVS